MAARIGSIALVGLLSCSFLTVTFGEDSKSPENVYLQPSQIPSPLHFQFLALGNRLQKEGNERITISAILSDSSGSNSAKVVMEKGGKLRIDKGSDSLRFDAKDMSRSPSANEEELLESLVDDLPETLIETAAAGNGIRFVGQRFDNKQGELCDLYDSMIPGKANKKNPRQTRRYCFDSTTKLLSWVQYSSDKKSNSPIIETKFRDWITVNGQAVPATVIRSKGGSPVFKLEAKEVQVSRAEADDLFKP
jgi:hypothetical protein